jgi:hypothetical protein
MRAACRQCRRRSSLALNEFVAGYAGLPLAR